MALKRRQFTREFKLQVVREVEAGTRLAQGARECPVHPTVIRRGQREPQPDAERAFAGQGHSYKEAARIAELERLVGQLTRANALLKKAVLRLEARGHGPIGAGGR